MKITPSDFIFITEILQVLGSTLFWKQLIPLYMLMFGLLFAGGIPYVFWPGKQERSLLSISFFGLLWILAGLHLYVLVGYFGEWNLAGRPEWWIFGILGLEWTVWLSQVFKQPRNLYSQAKDKLLKEGAVLLAGLALFSLLFLGMSVRYFDTEHATFFVPGYSLNQDSIKIAAGINMLQQESALQDNNFGRFVADAILEQYPLGGILLIQSVGSLLGMSVNSSLALVVSFIFLQIIFVWLYFLTSLFREKLDSPLPLLVYGLVFMSGAGYLSLYMQLTGVVASVMMMPLLALLFSLLILYKENKTDSSDFFLLFVLTLSGLSFLYSYLPLLLLGLFLILGWLSGAYRPNNMKWRRILIGSAAATASPYIIWNSLLVLRQHFSSTRVEANMFKGAKGGVPEFLDISVAFSLSPRHVPYRSELIPMTGFVLLTLFSLGLLILYRTQSKNPYLKHALAFSLPFLVLLFISRFVTVSTYQFSKVLHQFSIFLPIILFLFISPYLLSGRRSIKKLVNIFLISYLLISFSISLLAYRTISRPPIARNLEIIRVGDRICDQIGNETLAYIGPNEWPLAHLLRCNHVDLPYDRRVNWPAHVDFNQINSTSSEDLSCNKKRWKVPTYPALNYDYLLLDNCIDFKDPHYSILKKYDYHSLLIRKK